MLTSLRETEAVEGLAELARRIISSMPMDALLDLLEELNKAP